VQHANEAAQLFERNFLRRELLFELAAQNIQAGLAIEPIQNGEFFFLKAEVIQADGIFHNPELPPLIALLVHHQVRTPANAQRASRAGDEAIGKGGHLGNDEIRMMNDEGNAGKNDK
jgi:hypothetical protein